MTPFKKLLRIILYWRSLSNLDWIRHCIKEGDAFVANWQQTKVDYQIQELECMLRLKRLDDSMNQLSGDSLKGVANGANG